MKSYRNYGHLKNNLKNFRKFYGFSQTHLAHLCGTSQNTISSIENGTWYPSLYLALVISHVLGCDVNDLFSIDFLN